MTSAPDDLLSTFAAQSSLCTISLPAQPLALLRRSRVVGVDSKSVWLTLAPKDIAAAEALIAEGLPVYVTIRSEEQDVLFHSAPISVVHNFMTSEKRCVCAIQLRLPENITISQRRRTYRVVLTEQDDVQVRLYRINEYVLLRDRVLPSQELPCRPKDIGEGGFGATVRPLNSEALNLKANQRFRVEMKYGRHEMVFEARLRHPEQTHRDDESAECGFEFIYNERDIECRRSRQKLQLLLSELQRNAVKREQVEAGEAGR